MNASYSFPGSRARQTSQTSWTRNNDLCNGIHRKRYCAYHKCGPLQQVHVLSKLQHPGRSRSHPSASVIIIETHPVSAYLPESRSIQRLPQRARGLIEWICPTSPSGMIKDSSSSQGCLGSTQFPLISRAVRGPPFGLQTGLVRDQIVGRVQIHSNNSGSTGRYESSRKDE